MLESFSRIKKCMLEGRVSGDVSLQNLCESGSAKGQCALLLVLDKTFNSIPVQALKDDGCFSNTISREFARAHEHLLTLSSVLIDVSHSKRGGKVVAT